MIKSKFKIGDKVRITGLKSVFIISSYNRVSGTEHLYRLVGKIDEELTLLSKLGKDLKFDREFNIIKILDN